MNNAESPNREEPFGDSALLYRNRGWRGVLPLPKGRKFPPPERFTGRQALWPSEADVHAWLEDPARNVGLRVEPDVIGIDVDGYDGRRGVETMRKLVRKLGPLPHAWQSTARPPSSGIYLYRVPRGLRWHGEAGRHVDIIQAGHRYAVVWPSIHPSGAPYRWYLAGVPADEPPRVDQLAELPAAWVDYLTRREEHPEIADDSDPFHESRLFTRRQAEEFCRPSLDALASSSDGEVNNKLNTAAKVISHFVPAIYSRAEADKRLGDALACTVYDGATWQASDTIESAFASSSTDWKAVQAAPSGDVTPSESEDTEERPEAFLVDLGPYIDGTHVPPTPEIGARLPGEHSMLYAGKVHSLIGETESGKSWLALLCCLAEMQRGESVVYIHFEESDPSGTVSRLLAMGATRDLLRRHFRFAAPERRVTLAAIGEAVDEQPSLVVLDGVNDAMALHGWAINDADGVAEFRRILCRPLAAAGAAVLELDHVAKAVEGRGRDAYGSVHKGNGLDGARYCLETVEAFGRGRNGESQLFVSKDRPGHLRAHGVAATTAGKTLLGSLHVAASMVEETGVVKVAITAPPSDPFGEQAGGRDAAIDQGIYDTVLAIESRGSAATLNAVTGVARRRKQAVAESLARLEYEGRVLQSRGPRGAAVYTISTGSVDVSD